MPPVETYKVICQCTVVNESGLGSPWSLFSISAGGVSAVVSRDLVYIRHEFITVSPTFISSWVPVGNCFS